MLKKSNQKGFTIIEVLIVLAIAGLIMLIVFLAVPALQRNSRNTARNEEAARISALVTECLANRNGVVASCTAATIGFNAADFQQITSVVVGTAGTTEVANFAYSAKCNADGSGTAVGTARQFAVTYQLESAGSPVTRCIGSE